MSKPSLNAWLQIHVLRMSRLHFVYAAIFIVSTILFDAWNLITPDIIMGRWAAAAGLVVVSALVWYASRTTTKSTLQYQGLVYALIASDLAIATYMVYAQRGIASKSVLLYVIPIIVATALLSRAALFATAAISVALYSFVCVRYFYLNPGQAYKVELYGEVAFYSALLFLVAGFLWTLLSNSKKA